MALYFNPYTGQWTDVPPGGQPPINFSPWPYQGTPPGSNIPYQAPAPPPPYPPPPPPPGGGIPIINAPPGNPTDPNAPGANPLQTLLDEMRRENAALIEQQKQEQTANQANLAAQQKTREDARTQALASIPDIQNQLGQDLATQEQYSFEKAQPLIEGRLNALGLLQSGALPEAQAKYHKDLEMARQSRLADFGTEANRSLRLELPIQNANATAGGIGQGYQNQLDLSRAGFSRMFSLYDIFAQEQQARKQQDMALELARRARQEYSPYAPQNRTTVTTMGPSFDFTRGGNMDTTNYGSAAYTTPNIYF